MRLTTADLVRFVRGQLQIENKYNQSLYRGEIADIAVVNNIIEVRFEWVAKDKGYPQEAQRWVRKKEVYFTTNLEILMFRNINPTGEFRLESLMHGDVYILFPPNGSKLDRARVEGLDPVSR